MKRKPYTISEKTIILKLDVIVKAIHACNLKTFVLQ